LICSRLKAALKNTEKGGATFIKVRVKSSSLLVYKFLFNDSSSHFISMNLGQRLKNRCDSRLIIDVQKLEPIFEALIYVVFLRRKYRCLVDLVTIKFWLETDKVYPIGLLKFYLRKLHILSDIKLAKQ